MVKSAFAMSAALCVRISNRSCSKATVNLDEGKGEQMKAFLILEDGTVFTGTSIGSTRDMISEIVFNTSMTGYLEVLTDPSYAGQAVVMTYPLIGNYGITPDMESKQAFIM